jgi:oxygen-dependent protoporphyrinogen oxidase
MKYLILGGGISGLSAAWFCRKKTPDAEITLLEKRNRLGGYIATKSQGPFQFELGPRTFQRARSSELLSLIQELGLESHLVFSDPTASARYLWVQARLRKISSLWPQIIRALVQDACMPRGVKEEESIYEFASRRFGKKGADLFFDPLAKGVFGGDMRKLSLPACFPFLHQLEMTKRSILLGLLSKPKQASGLFTLRGGMVQLVEALRKAPTTIHSDCPVEAILPGNVLAGGRKWTADRIICALPGNETAKLTQVPLVLRNEKISVVNLGYEGKTTLHGYGYLVPSSENEELLGQIWDSAVFPGSEYTCLTSMIRSASPETAALSAMRRHLGEAREPIATWCQEAEIPQYDVGHTEKINQFAAEIRTRIPGLELVGNYLSGPSVESCILQSKSKIFTKN